MKWYYSPEINHREYISSSEGEDKVYTLINNPDEEELILQDYRDLAKLGRKFYLNDSIPATTDHLKYFIKLLFYYGKVRRT